MKKLIYLAGAALVMMASASCEKKADVQNPESKKGMVKTVFSAVSNESKEKTSISGSDILWSADDQVKIYAGTSTTGNNFTLTDGEGTTSAIFEGWIAETATAPYYAVYPSSAAQGIDGSTIKYSIPANQAYVENSFATSTVPMVAYSEADKSLAFKNQTAFIKLQLTGAGTIKTMEIASAANNICGTFSVSKTDPTAASTAVTGAKKITVTNIEGTELDASEAINVIIALAPANFAANDLTLSMTATDGKAFSTKLGGFTVGRSQGKAVAINVEFVTQTTGEAETKDGTMVKWVQLWENGPKWAEYNVGATSVGEYGGYYCWGGTYENGEGITWMDDHYTGSEDIQGGSHDTAKNLWGDKWQMPTEADYRALIASCDVDWKSESERGHGVAGLLVKGKGDYSGNSVFFPAAGYYYDGRVDNAGSGGSYWSSTPFGGNNAYYLLFDSNGQIMDSFNRHNGQSVRAVLAE
ncbi:MAG: hypothetical protein MJ010_05320 [Paludibacteraceae bacterium]|nr:hypothetical protein [Paludibacteraceae bacterium]